MIVCGHAEAMIKIMKIRIMNGAAAFAIRNRQTTLRMDRHETIVAERCETFRYYCIVGVLG